MQVSWAVVRIRANTLVEFVAVSQSLHSTTPHCGSGELNAAEMLNSLATNQCKLTNLLSLLKDSLLISAIHGAN